MIDHIRQDVIFRKFREFYKDGNLYFKMDVGGKEKEHKEICEKYGPDFSVQPMKVGRCGWMTHYEEWEDGSSEVPKEQRSPKENIIHMDG